MYAEQKEDIMSEKIQLFLLICIVAISSALTFMPPTPQEPIYREFTSLQNEEKNIIIFGDGEISVKLDTIEFTLFIQTSTNALEVSKSKNEEKFLKAMQVLDSHAIEKRDIIIENPQDMARIVNSGDSSYVVTKLVKVTLHDIAKLQPLITDLQAGGAEQITDIVFSATDSDQYYEQALQLAVQEAKKKAETIAATHNKKIGEPISIREVLQNFIEARVHFRDFDDFFTSNPSYPFMETRSLYNEVTIKTRVIVKFELK
jgi:uncharacterized protein YggE